MNVKELEAKISEEKINLVKLEAAYEKEEDEAKLAKLEYRIARKDEAIVKLIDRQQVLLDRESADEAEDEAKEDPKDKDAEEEDDDVCESCGGDLQQVDVDDEGVVIFECVRCKELYLDE